MNELMQTLYEYITEGKIQKYRGMTDYYTCQMIENHASQEFVEQLTEEQIPLFLRLEEANNALQCADMESIFLATVDLCRNLSHRF